jgi:hypothetical protein
VEWSDSLAAGLMTQQVLKVKRGKVGLPFLEDILLVAKMEVNFLPSLFTSHRLSEVTGVFSRNEDFLIEIILHYFRNASKLFL